jgi:hypothetical protein
MVEPNKENLLHNYTNNKEIINNFQLFEEKFELLSNKDYAFIWEGIRITVLEELFNKLSIFQNAHDSIRIKKFEVVENFKIFKNVVYSFAQLKSIRYNTYVNFLFFSNGRRKKDQNNIDWDIHIDPLIDVSQEEFTYQVFELPYHNNHSKFPKIRNIIYTDYYNLINTSQVKLKIGMLEYFSSLEEEFASMFNLKIDITRIALRFVRIFTNGKNNYYRLFSKYQTDIIFIICSYGKEAIICAAKELGIPIVELQHGIISPLHLGYDYPPNHNKVNFPDYFFSFGPAWGQMAHFPIPQEKIIPIGYQYLNTAVLKLKDVMKKDQVLFLSQGTIGDRLSDFAVNLLDHRPSHVSIVYKLHPGEYLRWRTEYKSLYDASEKGLITVIDGDNPPLYELMAESKWQIGVNSTALFEGMAFKCKTYIVDLPGIEYVETLIDNNEFFLVQKPEEIEFTYDPETLNYHTEEYFSQDTETKFKAAIDFVMKDYYA